MAGNSIGGKKCAIANKELYGENWYRELGAKGGKATGLKGFALATPEFRSKCGRKGGLLSRNKRREG